MANLTRIQNNQITDSTIQASAKLASGSITGNLLASTVTFNSNITILGNLTVANNYVQLNSINTYINDPLVVFNNGYNGSPSYDIGILVNRNLQTLSGYGGVNTAFVWKEADSAFEAIATTETGTLAGSINNSGWANIKTGNATINGTATITSILGVTGDATFTTGNIAGLQVKALGNVTPGTGAFTTVSTTGNLTVGGLMSITGNIVPSANVTYSLGTPTNRFKDLWLSGSTMYLGGFVLSEDVNGNINLTTNNGNRLTIVGTVANTVITTGNIVAPYHLGNIVGAIATHTTITTAGLQAQAIGNVTAGTGAFTTVTAGGLQAQSIGNITPGTYVFTTGSVAGLQAQSIGNATPGTGAFTTLTASGVTQVTNATASTATNNGALVVTGGVGIGGDLNVGGQTLLTGNVSIGGNLTVTGQSVSIGSTSLSINDPIINLHTPSDLTPLTSNDGADIGIKFHYYNGADKAAFLGMANDSKMLEWYDSGSDTGNVFSGTNYGGIKAGRLILSNASVLGGGLSANTGTFQVYGDGSINGNLYVGAAFLAGTASFAAINSTVIGNITPAAGTFTYVTVTQGFSSANARIVGAQSYIGGGTQIANVSAQYGTFPNLSSTNVLVSGGSLTNLTQVTATNVDAGTIVTTNLGSGNARIAGGYADNFAIGSNTAATGRFTTLTSTGVTTSSGNLVANSQVNSTNSTSGALTVVGGAGIAANVFVGGATTFGSNQTAGYDHIVMGKNDATLMWARSGVVYDQVLIGNTATVSNLVRGAKLIVNSTDSMILPAGTNAQRPSSTLGSDTEGMFRYNTTAHAPEYFNGTTWQSIVPNYTVITDETFTGTGSQYNFTLGASSTTAGTIVAINGVIQFPTFAYSVTGATLTFTEAPLTTDVIDVRRLTTTSQVTTLASVNGYMTISTDNNGVYISTGTVAPVVTTSWNTSGAEVNSTGNAVVTTASTPTVVDSFDATLYSSAEYTITSTIQGTNVREIVKVLAVHNGTSANITSFSRSTTSGNTLTTLTGAVSGSNFQLSATTTNNNTVLRIRKNYQSL